MKAGDRVEITDQVPSYVYLDHKWDQNTKLYLLVVGCVGTVVDSCVTWDGVPYVRLYLDADPDRPYVVGLEWIRPLSAIERLGGLVRA